MTLLDTWTPIYDVSATHTVRVKAPPQRVYEVARRLDLGTPALVRVLMGLRVLPALVLRTVSRRGRAVVPAAARHHSAVAGMPFVVLAEENGLEFVLGLMGRFWTASGGLSAATIEEFRLMPPPGLAQAFWNFRVEPDGPGSRVTTETRVRCGDAPTRQQFLRYWRVIRMGSALTRRSMLRRIRIEAERTGDPLSGPVSG